MPSPPPAAAFCLNRSLLIAGLPATRAGSAAAAPGGLLLPSLGGSSEGARFDSTKRKRAKMMNRHKYKKLQKRMRNLEAKNLKK
jgi:hypothetical protein